MDWSTVGKLVQSAAPTIGTLLLGPGLGSMAGSLVGGLIGNALGVPATPDAVVAAITSDPDALAKIKAVEDAHATELQALLLDTQNARSMQVATVAAGSKISWTVPALTFVWVGSFFVTLIALFLIWTRTSDPVAAQGVLGMIQLMIGALIGASTQTTNFWFGTTKSSHDNGVAVRAVAASK